MAKHNMKISKDRHEISITAASNGPESKHCSIGVSYMCCSAHIATRIGNAQMCIQLCIQQCAHIYRDGFRTSKAMGKSYLQEYIYSLLPNSDTVYA